MPTPRDSKALAQSTVPRTDKLAVERTLLSNERTFLAYFRTAVVFLSSGLAVLGLELFQNVRYVAVLLIVLSPPILAFGLWRYARVRNRTLRYLSE